MPGSDGLRQVQAWIAKADNDLKTIEYLLPHAEAPMDTACFHAHQAAEKYIKALLTFYGAPFRKTHDLAELVLGLPSESTISARVGDLAELSDVGIASRYPDDDSAYDRDTAERMVEQALAVKNAVLSELRSCGYTVSL